MTHEEAVDRAVKLLKLAKSDNANEAALAASKAQEVIDRYKLDAGALALDESETPERPKEDIREIADPLTQDTKRSTWKIRLAVELAQVNACRVLTRGGPIHIVGRPSDAQTVRYLFELLASTTDKLAARDGKGNGRVWCNNYRLGVVETIGRRLQEQKEATKKAMQAEAAALPAGAGTSALVRVNNAIVRMEQEARETDAWVSANLKLRKGAPVRMQEYFGAREAGRRAGHEIRIGGACAGLGSGS